MTGSPRRPPAARNETVFVCTNKWEDCKACCPNPDVILDCGANVGQTAANLRQAYPNAIIYCFEPVASVFEELQRRAEQWHVHPERIAVSDFNGQATMHLTASPESNSLFPFLKEHNPLTEPHRVVGEEPVRVVRLDDWCRSVPIEPSRIDVLKMDVQGSELDALNGATTILQTVKLVLLEVAFVPFYRGCPLHRDIDSFMVAHGFACRSLYRSAQPEVWADALYVPTTPPGQQREDE